MSEDVYERIKRSMGANRQAEDNGNQQDPLKESPADIPMPPIVVGKKSYSGAMVAPESSLLGTDRRSRREIQEAERERRRIGNRAIKYGTVVRAVSSVNVYAVQSMDQTQEEMMATLHGKHRYPGMNQLMNDFIAMCLQQTSSDLLALTELHTRQQMENV